MSDVDVRTTVHLERCLARLETQDATVRSGLLKYARRRLELLADRMFARFPMLHPQEKAENVFQEAMLRLWRSLEEAGPATVADFMVTAPHWSSL